MAKHKHPWIRRMLGVGVLAGVSYAIWRAIEANRTERDLQWDPQPFPFPPQPRTEENGWVEPVDGVCPATHPVKAKLTSGIFHQPGGLSYDATKPDRCYRDAGAAESDGLRPSKR